MERHETDRETRGPNAPADSLSSAIQLLNQVRDRLGFSAASRETLAEALGYKTLNGTSRRKIAVLNHFELLSRNGSRYRVSQLGKQILMPRDDSEYRVAIATAARKPAFYQTLLTRYEGQALPGMLPNILVREFNILPQSSDEVARIFRETMEFAGLLRHGILLEDPEPTNGAPTSPEAEQSLVPGVDNDSQAATELQSAHDVVAGDSRQRQRYTIALDKRGTVATLELPVPMRERDLKKVSAWIDYMTTVVNDSEDAITASDSGEGR